MAAPSPNVQQAAANGFLFKFCLRRYQRELLVLNTMRPQSFAVSRVQTGSQIEFKGCEIPSTQNDEEEYGRRRKKEEEEEKNKKKKKKRKKEKKKEC